MDKIPPPPPPPPPQRHVAPKAPTPRPQNAAIPIPPSSQETHPPQEFIDTDGQDEEAPPTFEEANRPSTPLSEEDNQEKYLPVQETDPAPQALYDPQQQDEHTMDGDSTGEEKLI